MDCEERLARQVQMTTEASPHTKVWVYRNSILALPWYTSVRVKLEDPAYGYWFLNFSVPVPGIKQHGNANTTCDLSFDPPKCSMAFHDSEKNIPGYPSGDGDCAAPGCDVGSIPIGAYLFNPAAANHSVNGQTFTEWFVDEYLFGPNGGANPNISGFFFDDQFNPTGATESEGTLANLGLTKEQGEEYSAYYWQYMKVAYDELLKRGKFSWQQMWSGQAEGYGDYKYLCSTSPQPLVTKVNCASQLRKMCSATSQAQTRAMFFSFNGSPEDLPEFEQDLANFLLTRGEHAWLGHAWKGCSRIYVFPEALNKDYGEPTEICAETAENSGVFTREWTKASIKMDCNSYTPTIKMNAEASLVVV
jgi:hypothetical protein